MIVLKTEVKLVKKMSNDGLFEVNYDGKRQFWSYADAKKIKNKPFPQIVKQMKRLLK